MSAPRYMVQLILTERQLRTMQQAVTEKKETTYEAIRRVSKESPVRVELEETFKDLHVDVNALDAALKMISNPPRKTAGK